MLGWWIAYHASIIGTLLLSQLLFLAARLILPLLLASVLGTVVAAAANFVLMNRFVFRQPTILPQHSEDEAGQRRRHTTLRGFVRDRNT